MRSHSAQGFSLVELLIASTITLVVVGATLDSFRHGMAVNDAATLIGDSSQNLRAGGALMMRELMQAGRLVPTGGIPIPNGVGVTAIKRPGPPGTNYTFGDPSITTVLPPVVPGSGLGPRVLGVATDMVTILLVDTKVPLDQFPLASVAADGSSATVNAATVLNDPATGIVAGDLILFKNGLGSALQTVTGLAGQQINFDPGDWFNLNQRNALQGTILNLKAGAAFPPTTAFRVQMLTFYVDATTTPDSPRLVRQVNHYTASGQALAGTVESLVMTYDLYDGGANPSNVPTPVPPNTPQQIREINLTVGVRSDMPSMQLHRYVRTQVNTAISLRNLAFVDRYR
jgi:hypothetical protein